VLHGISFDVAPGETVALMGGNGSGKTTLVRAIIGALPLTAGSIEIGGLPTSPAARARLGYVPQRVGAAAGISVTATEIVTSGMLRGNRLAPPPHAKARALEALAAVGLADLAKRDVNAMSGGQQQRVLIARAMVRRPDLLLLDEPVSGVDLPSQEVFSHALADLKAGGATIIVVLHEVGMLAKMIDRAVVLDRGRVVHVGAPPHAHGDHALPGHDHIHPHDDGPNRPGPDRPTFEISV
jgi:zinc transport system ATP-binding protein